MVRHKFTITIFFLDRLSLNFLLLPMPLVIVGLGDLFWLSVLDLTPRAHLKNLEHLQKILFGEAGDFDLLAAVVTGGGFCRLWLILVSNRYPVYRAHFSGFRLS